MRFLLSQEVKMDKLKAAGLFGGELVKLTGSLARRYNDCLAMFGVSPTSLISFSIDAMGWSPEIAEEKGDNYYLNIGEANSNAIIISPNQMGKPAHMPSHSFDRDLMNAVFVAYEKPIRDITKDSAICLNLDQNIDAFYECFDLLQYDTVTVTFRLLNDLEKRQDEQLDLIKKFDEGNAFMDREVHAKILTSAKTYGDLRTRKLRLEPLPVRVKSFYTRAFGGVFILKDFIKDIMIFESKEEFDKAIKNISFEGLLFHKDHDELIETLVSHLILEKDLKKSLKTPRYERIKKHIFSEYVKNPAHSFKEILDSHFLFVKYLNELDVAIQKKINGVELYFQKRIIDKNIKQEDYIDKAYSKAFYEPHSSLDEEQKELIYKLLTKISPIDPVHSYWYDKATFYKNFKSWEETYKDWVIDRILEENKKHDL
ncbi:DUF6638 family protein [Ulvibacter antarcticus]|uniref:Uncharacterized protein n=1 Tax=Ulvibacter antarcticus TaxID=442714 RepID=A0A3L9YCQ1_9FLAO|nr:DUF6638 family protein [Ulvibacter antarcticus]RMA57160.1 hypothetical protein BXY75_3047 [Ulvibacter antarcticus]